MCRRERRRRTELAIKRQLDFFLSFMEIDWIKNPEAIPGMFKKKKFFDCGRSRCGVCHYHKYPVREKTLGERKFLLSSKEQLKDLE